MTDRPLHASNHCRHYSYQLSIVNHGPRCAVDIDLSQPAACQACMPDPKGVCERREEYTDAERAAWKNWRASSYDRLVLIAPLIPGSSRDKKNREHWGESGQFDCPACKTGKVTWARARSNGHLSASCSTPDCFGVIE